jgi:hypothetical protein
MSSEEKVIRVKKLRIITDKLVIEPMQIVIRRPGKEKKVGEEEEEVELDTRFV